MKHDFKAKKQVGEIHAQRLDALFAPRFDIRRVDQAAEWNGIDRVFIDRGTGREFTVEYKSDEVANRTHNIFVETVSNDVSRRKGWAYTCAAAYLMYYIPGDELVYILRPSRIRRKLGEWCQKYRTVKSPNTTYNTHGVLVPLCEFETISDQVVSI